MSYFVYDGTSIKTLLPGSELAVAVLDSFDEIDGNLGREIIKGEVNSERYSPNYITSLFNEVVNFDLFIYKTNESDFTTEEQRKLTKLLTSARTPKWFSSYDCNDNLIANYRGLFTQVTYKIFSGLKGFQVHFENDSPYDYDIVNNLSIYPETALLIDSDAEEKIYPIVKIEDAYGKNITITETISELEYMPEYNRNIVTGSQKLELGTATTGNWANKKWRTSGTGDSINTDLTAPFPPNWLRYGVKLTASTEGTQIGIVQDAVPLVEGKKYTMSCWVRANTENLKCRLQVFYRSEEDNGGACDFTVGTNWTHISFTAKSAPSQSMKYSTGYVCLMPTAIGNYIEVCGIKVEEGENATPWEFAVEDISTVTKNTISLSLKVPNTSELYIDCKNCMFYTKIQDELEQYFYSELGIKNAEDLAYFYLSTKENYVNKFECSDSENTDVKYDLLFDYIIPQKRAIRWW